VLLELVAVFLGVSLGLVVGAGLLVRTVAALRSIEPGFEPGAVVEASVDAGIQGYDSGARARFFQSMVERGREIYGVRAAGMSWAPVQGFMRASALPRPEGEPEDGERAIRAAVNGVLPGSIAALGIERIDGRNFRDEEMVSTVRRGDGRRDRERVRGPNDVSSEQRRRPKDRRRLRTRRAFSRSSE
jgi:hypothetical protein